MEGEILDKLREILCSNADKNQISNIDKNNFREIAYIESDKIVAFVDGGNSEILEASNFLLATVRTSLVLFKNNKKEYSKIFNFYILSVSKEKNGKLYYETEIFLQKLLFGESKIELDSSDESFKKGMHRADIKSIPGIIRSIAEIKTSLYALKNLHGISIIVLDGNLEYNTAKEKECVDELFKEAMKNNVNIAALSKTSSLLINNGFLASYIIGKNSPYKKWHYKIEDKELLDSGERYSDLFFAKLHENSKHTFRVDIFNKNVKNNNGVLSNNEIFSLLAANSKDAVFPGYPYGLIEADRLARISNREADYLRNSIIVKLGNMEIDYFLNSNVHDILDSIRF